MSYFDGFTSDEIVYADGFKLRVSRIEHRDCDCALCRPTLKQKNRTPTPRQPWQPVKRAA